MGVRGLGVDSEVILSKRNDDMSLIDFISKVTKIDEYLVFKMVRRLCHVQDPEAIDCNFLGNASDHNWMSLSAVVISTWC